MKTQYIKQIVKKLYGNRKRVEVKKAKVLNKDEIKRVINYCNSSRYSLRNSTMVMLAYFLGMRVGEIANLRVCDVLNEANKVKDEIYLSVEQTKGNDTRTVYVNSKAKKALEAYAESLVIKDRKQKFFFSQSNNGFSPNSLSQYFYHLFKAVGIDGASSHSFRRTFITNLANKGVSVRVLGAIVGHKNISTTQQYIDLNDEMVKQAIELIWFIF